MKVDLYSATGTKAGSLELPASMFEAPINKGLMHLALMRQHQTLCSLRFRVMLQHLAMHGGANAAKRQVSHHLLGLMGSYGQPHLAGTLISITFTKQ